MGFSPEPQTHQTCKNEMVPFAFGENRVLGFVTRLMMLSPYNLTISFNLCTLVTLLPSGKRINFVLPQGD